MALSTQPYKGARDFYPEAKRLQKYMFTIWREVCERFGYEEYDAPILEPLEIYLAKTGDEIVNEQTYSFEDRGGRQVVIRPEMTPSVSRMVAARRQQLAYPLRWYSIPNLWRYERPQRGRLREHWQLNVDIFGVAETSAELEVVTLVDAIFKAFSATADMYKIHLNHRGLINYLLADYLGLDSDKQQMVGKLIDRFHKMDRSLFITKLDEILSPAQRQNGTAEKLLALLSVKRVSDLPAEVTKQPAALELKALFEQLKTAHVQPTFDASLMRGFDYYTGIVFEVFDMNPDNNRSMLGGGRYDGLVGLFGVQPVPTVGFGWGDVTLVNFLEGHHLMPKLTAETDVYVATVGKVTEAVQKPVSVLREAGINVAVDLSGKKIADQLKAANKRSIDYVLVIGENELKSAQFKLKNLQTGQEVTAPLAEVISKLKARG